MAKASPFESFFPTSNLAPPEAVRDHCDRTVKRAAEFSRSLMASMSQSMEGQFELASRLIHCNDPTEALAAWKDWMEARREAMLADSKNLAAQWAKLCEIDMEMMATAARKATEQATNISTMPRAAAGE